MPDDVFDRLSSLERSQFLAESASRRHAEALDRHADDLAHHRERMDALQRTMDTLVANQTALQALALQTQQTLDAIKDLLERRNGH
jgi:prefoldin subunit 5